MSYYGEWKMLKRELAEELAKPKPDKEKYEHLNANDFKFAGMKRMQRGRRR